MNATDVIADMLTRIRNAASSRHEIVDVPASNLKRRIAENLVSILKKDILKTSLKLTTKSKVSFALR